MSPLDIASMVLSVSSIAISLIAFFASIYFFRHSIDLQKSSDSAVANVNAIAETIRNQVDQLFSKTLDAALDNQHRLHEIFLAANDSIDKARHQIQTSATPLLAIEDPQSPGRKVIE